MQIFSIYAIFAIYLQRTSHHHTNVTEGTVLLLVSCLDTG